jgi:hypothetical protein
MQHIRLWPLALLVVSTLGFAQQDKSIEVAGFTHTDDINVKIELGSDGARGGNQLLLLVQMKDGSTRKFDLNRSREEWGGNSTRDVTVVVQPPLVYANIERMGLEWHGSRGDMLQEQDDVDLKSIMVQSKAAGSPWPLVNGSLVDIVAAQNVRLENDQTYWLGGIRPRAWYMHCASDQECGDGRYCNGVELCSPGDPRSDASGCIAGTPPCSAGQTCNETIDRCEMGCTDNDGDGHLAMSCGGDDCDDNDSNRYPGNVEINDAADHDEDCDVNTHGFYRGANSTQICDGRDQVVLVDARERFTRASCSNGTVCVPQPNGDGVCMVEPSGYQVPGRATAPSRPQQAPPATLQLQNNAGSNPSIGLIRKTPAVPAPKKDEGTKN